MRSVLQGKIEQPDFVAMTPEISAEKVPEKGVIKPRRAEASLGVDFYTNQFEFERTRANLAADDELILEEAVDYDVMFTCDGVFIRTN